MTRQTQFTRRQHTVAQWHLRGFTNADGKFFRYLQGMPVKWTCPKAECHELDFYEYDFHGRKSHNKFEHLLGQIENNAASRLPHLLNKVPLSRQGCKDWALYVASLFVRSRKYRAQISEPMIANLKAQTKERNYIADLQYTMFKKGELVEANELRRSTDEFVSNLEKSPAFYHVAGLQRHTASLAAALLKKAWHIVRAPQEKFFLMSDCPVSTAEVAGASVLPGVGFAKEHALVFVPITPRLVFIAAPSSMQRPAIAPPAFVDSLNLLTVQFAHTRVFAHVNMVSIKEFVDREIGLIVFGKNAFLAA
jgi:hypothetical protein